MQEPNRTLLGCSISASKSLGSHAGIIEVGVGSPTIENTSIVGTTTTNGIFVGGWTSPMVKGCTISGNSSGIVIDNGGGTYTGNQFKDNLHHGIYTQYGDDPGGNPIFAGNTYSNNPDGDLFWVRLFWNGAMFHALVMLRGPSHCLSNDCVGAPGFGEMPSKRQSRHLTAGNES